MLLNGVRVVEVGQILAGPLAAEILGDLGADVIKVEKPDGGDDCRGWAPPYWEGDAALFHQINRNKRSVVIDLKSPRGRELLQCLLGEADVFIHNLRPGAVDALGLSPAAMRARHSRLIYADIGAFGHKGPLAAKPGYELLMQAFGGVMSITGEADRNPVRAGPSINDIGTGMWAAIGILAALHQRSQTGQGCLVQTSLFETALSWTSIAAVNYLASGNRPKRLGSAHPSVMPYGVFSTKTDPLIVAAGNDRLFARLAGHLKHPEWSTDARFATNDARVRNRDELERLVTAALQTEPREHWVALFEGDNIPCAPILEIPEVLNHEHTRALDIIQQMPGSDDIKLIGMPVSFDGARPAPRRPALKLGQHTEEVLNKEPRS